jgi:hypothetical protein
MRSPSAPLGTPPRRRFLYPSQGIAGVSSRGSDRRRFTLPGLIYNSALRSADTIHEGNPSLSGLIDPCDPAGGAWVFSIGIPG